jgi:hypothetical protein
MVNKVIIEDQHIQCTETDNIHSLIDKIRIQQELLEVVQRGQKKQQAHIQEIRDRIENIETTPRPTGICDAHELLVDSIGEVKQGQKDMMKELKTLNKYVIEKQTENGVVTVIAQRQDQSKDNRLKNILQIAMAIIAITAIIVGALN